MKKALVIGSEGNIGKPLVKHLKENDYEVKRIDIEQGWEEDYYVADINQPLDMLPAFDWNPDVVFVLSAMVSRVTCEQASSLAVSTNLSGMNNVIQLCKRVAARTVFFSTSEVYGPGTNPMKESDSDLNPNNRYGLSKLLAERLIQYEVDNYDLNAVILRPFMIYEEHEDLGDHRSAMIRFASDLYQGKPIEVHTGTARSWLHISDAVEAIRRAGEIDKYSIINIGHPDVTPIEELAELIRQELDADENLMNFREQPGQMTPVKNPTLDRQRELLDFTPDVELEEGVKWVCDSIRERLGN